uniref:WW domain-containing protein n=1 Tax=Podarcis muralis TaxID=64176 RepID=A0A670IP67_PODMU
MPAIVYQGSELPLPAGWEEARDYDRCIFYINHNTWQTLWIDPPGQDYKATDISCVGDELPLGWEIVYDQQIGVDYSGTSQDECLARQKTR